MQYTILASFFGVERNVGKYLQNSLDEFETEKNKHRTVYRSSAGKERKGTGYDGAAFQLTTILYIFEYELYVKVAGMDVHMHRMYETFSFFG